MRLLLFAITLTTSLYAQSWTNWNEPWPTTVKTSSKDFEVNVLEEDKKTNRYIYESQHFSFQCDVKLTTNLVRKFAWYFESTHKYIETIPLSLARTQETKKHKILLFEHKKDYYKNGGLPNSGGVFFPNKDLIMVPLSSLGVKKVGSRYTVDYDKSNKTLSHEIVHSLTDFAYFSPGSRSWFTEGLAEYIGNTPYRSGLYIANIADNAVKDYVTAYGRDNTGGRAIGNEIKVGSLRDFFLMPTNQFWANANRNYGIAALLVTYFCDLRRNEELTNLQNFLKALKEGKKGEAAIEALLNGRSYKELEKDISKIWRTRRVYLDFSNK